MRGVGLITVGGLARILARVEFRSYRVWRDVGVPRGRGRPPYLGWPTNAPDMLFCMKKLLFGAALGSLLLAQSVDERTFARIRSEEAEHSQIMHTLHMLTDRYGPRLTGSPNHEAAAKWAAKQLTDWGFKNAKLEPWDFGHPGWLNDRATGFLVAPVRQNLKFEVLAWTPSTKGTVTGATVETVVPRGPEVPRDEAVPARGGRGGPQYRQPTQAELTAWMEANKSKVKGKVVLVGKA